MRGVNKVIIVGTLGKDPEVRLTPGGKNVATVSVATNERWKDKATGEQKESTEWHRVVVWDRLAEIVGEYLRKGSQVYFEGRLQTREYEKDGSKRYITEIRATEMQMLGGNDRGDRPAKQAAREAAPATEQAATEGFDDEIPF